jgi:hypothetical protein
MTAVVKVFPTYQVTLDLAANIPATPSGPADLLQVFAATDTGSFSLWNPASSAWVSVGTIDASRITTGTLSLTRLSLATGHTYVGNGSGNPADSSVITVTAGGNVGINTTSTSIAQLSLGQHVSTDVLHVYDDGTNRYGIGIAANQLQIFGASGAHISFGTRNNVGGTFTELVQISSAGGLTLDNYGAGDLITSASGVVTAVSPVAVTSAQTTYPKPSLASGTYNMLGIGLAATPRKSGNLLATFSGFFHNAGTASAVSDTIAVIIAYGTGTAPVAGAAQAGTRIGGFCVYTVTGAMASGLLFAPCSMTGLVTGLTPGTTYWFDVQETNLQGGNSLAPNNATLTVTEI